MKTKSKKFPTFKRGDLVQSLGDDEKLHNGRVVEGPYSYFFIKGAPESPAYTVEWKDGPCQGSMKISQAEDLSFAPKIPTLLEAVEAFLCHHRVSALRGVSDTMDDRFAMLDAAVKSAKEVK